MPSHSTLDVMQVVVMVFLTGTNTWLVYSRYRRCMKHLREAENAAALVSQDLADITFGAMLAVASAVLLGMSIPVAVGELRWLEAAVLASMLAFIFSLALRPFRQLLQRIPR